MASVLMPVAKRGVSLAQDPRDKRYRGADEHHRSERNEKPEAWPVNDDIAGQTKQW
jgi:hypothetical protein